MLLLMLRNIYTTTGWQSQLLQQFFQTVLAICEDHQKGMKSWRLVMEIVGDSLVGLWDLIIPHYYLMLSLIINVSTMDMGDGKH